jgi:mono/diheme cytochrome c family protein
MMKTLVACAGVVLIAAVVGAQAPSPAQPASAAQGQDAAKPAAPAAPAGNVDTGKKLWVDIGCWQCHGYEAQGGAAGPRLAARNLPFAGFSAYVRRPINQMPPYTEKVVPNTDLAHLYAYIQSRPAPAAVQSIPLLQK